MAGIKGTGGRPPKPTKEHKRDGTYRPHRHADRSDVLYEQSVPARPDGLGEHGSRLWDQIVDNTPSAVMRIVDTTKLARVCRLWQQWIELDSLIASGDDDCKTWDRWLKVGAQWDRLSSDFGIGPASRARIKATPLPQSVDSPMAQLQRMLAQRN